MAYMECLGNTVTLCPQTLDHNKSLVRDKCCHDLPCAEPKRRRTPAERPPVLCGENTAGSPGQAAGFVDVPHLHTNADSMVVSGTNEARRACVLLDFPPFFGGLGEVETVVTCELGTQESEDYFSLPM